MDTITFRKIRGTTLANLYVGYVNDVAVGMVHRPRNSGGDKNFWRCYLGIGDDAQFLGHTVTRGEAQNHVHWAYALKNASVVNRC